jgi:hypothetical protein
MAGRPLRRERLTRRAVSNPTTAGKTWAKVSDSIKKAFPNDARAFITDIGQELDVLAIPINPEQEPDNVVFCILDNTVGNARIINIGPLSGAVAAIYAEYLLSSTFHSTDETNRFLYRKMDMVTAALAQNAAACAVRAVMKSLAVSDIAIWHMDEDVSGLIFRV